MHTGEKLPPLYTQAREPLSPAEAGRIGARRRWGEPRVLRLDSLTPEQRRLVLALVAAAKAAEPERAA